MAHPTPGARDGIPGMTSVSLLGIVGPYAYIRRVYGVPAMPGGRITMSGRHGTILEPKGDPHYLRVRFDGERRFALVHPTWDVEYLQPATANGTAA